MNSAKVAPIYKYPRPAYCHGTKANPSVSWGVGLSPANTQEPTQLLAIAWDKVIVLMNLFDTLGNQFETRSDITVTNDNKAQEIYESRDMEQVGYYCSEAGITSVKFLTYSLLMVILEKDKIIILNTRDFIQGKVEEITHEKQPHEVVRSFKYALSKSHES